MDRATESSPNRIDRTLAWSHSGLVFFRGPIELPERCIRCGTTTNLQSRRELLTPTAGGPGAMARVIFGKSVSIDYHICEKCLGHNLMASKVRGIVAVLAFFTLLVAPAPFFNGMPWLGALLAATGLGGIGYLSMRYGLGGGLTMQAVDSTTIRVKGANPNVVEWVREG